MQRLNCNHHATASFHRFKKAVEKGEIDEQEQKRAHARQSLERYMHYWQRWAENDSSRKKVGSYCSSARPARPAAAAWLAVWHGAGRWPEQGVDAVRCTSSGGSQLLATA